MPLHHATARRATRPAVTLAGVLCFSLTGCAATDWIAGKDGPAPVVPEDFVGEATEQVNIDAQPIATQADSQASAGSDSETSTEEKQAAENPRVIDAMIGHINGEALYAKQILRPLEAQLAAMGRLHDGEAFLENAKPLILGRMQEVLIDKLVLGEAERDLSSRDRERLDVAVQQERDELIRFHGQGSLATAQVRFEDAMGISLEDHLKTYRDSLTVRRYMEMQIRPKIVVNQRDIERYFHDNADEYNRPASRAIRLIVATSEQAGETIEKRLNAGEKFAVIAGDETLNRYNPALGGTFNSGKPIAGDTVVAIDSVNEAILALEEGEYAGPIRTADRVMFVQLIEYNPAQKTDLEEVQIQIRQMLWTRQFKFHSDQFRSDLIERGSYTDLQIMVDKLIEVAVARFDAAG